MNIYVAMELEKLEVQISATVDWVLVPHMDIKKQQIGDTF